ncbi:Alpha-2-antiplasmin [Thelohanellus kitauei]|uniref:Alpha-2-antiplasmin n=1 Tax=Thelohanellus kitauei TaxID=669202 RepID=A0A0C2N8T7_THEKT|nr:Alpha-2-antiplasmin [Thelohanellus kitauei]
MSTYFDASQLKYVHLKLPKFQINGINDFIKTFMHFEVTDIFDLNHSDFGRMTNQTVFIGNLMQVSNLAIDELGIRTYAATVASVGESGSPREEFYVTRPFLFMVYSSLDRLVFIICVVTNPNTV